jgi:hypothetical protein
MIKPDADSALTTTMTVFPQQQPASGLFLKQ